MKWNLILTLLHIYLYKMPLRETTFEDQTESAKWKKDAEGNFVEIVSNMIKSWIRKGGDIGFRKRARMKITDRDLWKGFKT